MDEEAHTINLVTEIIHWLDNIQYKKLNVRQLRKLETIYDKTMMLEKELEDC